VLTKVGGLADLISTNGRASNEHVPASGPFAAPRPTTGLHPGGWILVCRSVAAGRRLPWRTR